MRVNYFLWLIRAASVITDEKKNGSKKKKNDTCRHGLGEETGRRKAIDYEI